MMNKIKKSIPVLLFCMIVFFNGVAHLHAEYKIDVDDTTKINIGALFRSYLINDQRIQWSGVETSFGVESVLTADLQKKFKWGKITVFSQFFINQPFNRNILADESRVKYLQNFKRDTIEVKQLYIQLDSRKFAFGLGKHHSFFGRDYTRGLSNSFFDYPFIRNEAIINFETGLFLRYHPGIFTLDIAITNGCEDLDTNSAKAFVVRMGLQGKNDSWSVGVSAKGQDGIGSEWQKQYKNHAGFDAMAKIGNFRVSSEIIYDQYGFKRDFPIDDVTWGRSYYYRDLFYKTGKPITGVGGYLDIQYLRPGSDWFFELNVGEYFPKKIGNIYHDDPVKRGIVKVEFQLASHLHAFGVGLIENKRKKEPLFKGASDYAFSFGLQYD